MIKSKILNIFVGKPKFFRGQVRSSIARAPVSSSINLFYNGLDGDEVADNKNHGGPDKALHLYPFEHYQYWQDKIGDHPLLEQAGAFGENISALGLTEDKVKIGDQFQIGEAIIELSHGRQPCWKIEHHFNEKNMVKDIFSTSHCGLYFRVINEGKIDTGDMIEQIYTSCHDWSVKKTFQTIFSGQYKDQNIQYDLQNLIELDTLAGVWKSKAKSLIL